LSDEEEDRGNFDTFLTRFKLLTNASDDLEKDIKELIKLPKTVFDRKSFEKDKDAIEGHIKVAQKETEKFTEMIKEMQHK